MIQRVHNLLLHDAFFDASEESELEKARLIRRTFGDELAMRVISLERLQKLREIPRSSCHETVSVEEAHEAALREGKKARIFMCSHRWLRPSTQRTVYHPDDENNSKARILADFAKWYTENRQQIDLHTKDFFFIDFSCIDQDSPLSGTLMLPLYVATCHNVVCFETSDFSERAWCLLEVFMGCVLCHGGDFPFVINRTFANSGQREHRETRLLSDPTKGKLTLDTDANAIAILVRCVRDEAKSTRRVRPVTFGQTFVRVRKV